MALKDKWTNKQDGVDDILAEDINTVAQELIDTQEEAESHSKVVSSGSYNADIRNYSEIVVTSGDVHAESDSIKITAKDGEASVEIRFLSNVDFESLDASFYLNRGSVTYYGEDSGELIDIDALQHGNAASAFTAKERFNLSVSDDAEIIFTRFYIPAKNGIMPSTMAKRIEDASRDIDNLKMSAGVLAVETTLEELGKKGIAIGTGNAVGNRWYAIGIDSFTISISGEVHYEIESQRNVNVYIDDAIYELGAFSGVVNKSIRFESLDFSGGEIILSKLIIPGYKGGILSNEQAEKLITSEKFTPDEKTKLKDTQIFTSVEKASLEKVSKIKDAGFILADKTLTELQNDGKLIADSSTAVTEKSLEGGTEVTINTHGNVYINTRGTKASTLIYADEKLIADGKNIQYEGYVNTIKIVDTSGIKIGSLSIKLAEYNGGYMTAEHLKDIEALKASVGNIGVVFNEIHEYAESLIGGEEA